MCCRAENTNALPCGDTFVRFACWFLCTRKDKAVGEQIGVFIVQVDENNFLLTPPTYCNDRICLFVCPGA